MGMKKCYYEGPCFKLCRGPGVPLLNFNGGPGSQNPEVKTYPIQIVILPSSI